MDGFLPYLDRLVDVTLRDGALGLGFGFSDETVHQYVTHLGRIGVLYCEVGFLGGPAGWGKDPVQSLNFDAAKPSSLLDPADPALPALWRMLDGQNSRAPDPAAVEQVPRQLIRITVATCRLAEERGVIERYRDAGFPISVNLKHSGEHTPEECVVAAREAAALGAETFYIVDTAGSMVPEDVRRRVDAVQNTGVEIKLGFHGHDSVGCAVANTLIALDMGCSYADVSFAGVGAGGGNTPLEIVLLLCSERYDARRWLDDAAACLAPNISQSYTGKAFWGRIGCSGAERREMEAEATRRGVPASEVAWHWRYGTMLAASDHATVSLLERRDAPATVRKTATVGHSGELVSEIHHNLSAIERGAPVPTIVRATVQDTIPYYETLYKPGRNLRDLMLDTQVDEASVVGFAERTLDALFAFYYAGRGEVEPADFAYRAYVQRPRARLERARVWAPEQQLPTDWTPLEGLAESAVRALFRATAEHAVNVDGRILPPWRQALEWLDTQWRELLLAPPSSMRILHGDPHFGNVVVGGDGTPWLTDGGSGFRLGDIAYDVAKFLMSVGTHDLIVGGATPPPQVRRVGEHVELPSAYRTDDVASTRVRRIREHVCRSIGGRLRASAPDDPGLERRVVLATTIHHLAIATTLVGNRGWRAFAILVAGLKAIDIWRGLGSGREASLGDVLDQVWSPG